MTVIAPASHVEARYQGLTIKEGQVVGDLILAQIKRQSAVFEAARRELQKRYDEISEEMEPLASVFTDEAAERWQALSRERSGITAAQHAVGMLFPKVLDAL